MTDEVMVEAGAATETVAPESQEVDVATTEAQGEQTEQGSELDPVKALEAKLEKERRRFERREHRRYSELAQERADRQRLEAELQRYRQPAREEQPESVTPDDIDRLATERAQQMRREETIARQSGDIRSAAIKAAGGEDKFAQVFATVVEEAGPLADARTGQWTPLGEAIADSDKPGELLVYLGRNPDVAETLQGLTGGRLHRAVAKIEAQMQTKAVPPPKPLKPVTPSGVTAGRSAAQMTDEEFYAARRGRK
jgi:hypothetical protein